MGAWGSFTQPQLLLEVYWMTSRMFSILEAATWEDHSFANENSMLNKW